MLNIYHAKKQSLLLVSLLLMVLLEHPFPFRAIGQIAQSIDAQPTQMLSTQVVIEEFITLLIQQKFELARLYLSPNLQNSWTAKDLEQKWQKLLHTVGTVNNIVQIRPTTSLNGYTALVTMRFRDSISDFLITLDQNQKVAAFDFRWLGDMHKNAEEFVDSLSTGKYGAARSFLEPRLKRNYLPETLKQRWETIQANMGAFKRRTSSKLVRSSNSDVVVVNLEFEKASGSFMIVFNPLSEIIGIDFPKTDANP